MVITWDPSGWLGITCHVTILTHQGHIKQIVQKHQGGKLNMVRHRSDWTQFRNSHAITQAFTTASSTFSFILEFLFQHSSCVTRYIGVTLHRLCSVSAMTDVDSKESCGQACQYTVVILVLNVDSKETCGQAGTLHRSWEPYKEIREWIWKLER